MRNITEGIIGAYGQEVEATIKVGEEIVATNEDLSESRIYYDSNLFKTTMQCYEFACEERLFDEDDQVNPVFIFSLDGESTSIDFGTFVVKSSEEQAEDGTIRYTAYDLMDKAMDKYQAIEGIEYPISVSDYASAIAVKLGLGPISIVNRSSLVNGSMLINQELYDESYTYRDVLEQLAETTACMIAIRADKLAFIYPSLTPYSLSDDGVLSAYIKGAFEPNSLVLSRGDVEDSVIAKDDEKIAQNGLNEVKFNNNQIMDSVDDSVRLTFATNILNHIKAYHFDECDVDTFGIGAIEAGDAFTIQIADHYVEKYDDEGEVIAPIYTTYTCLMTHNEFSVSGGVEEKASFERPKESETDYTIGAEAVDYARRAYVKVDKQENRINSLVEVIGEDGSNLTEIIQTTTGVEFNVVNRRLDESINGSHIENTADGVRIYAIVNQNDDGSYQRSGSYTSYTNSAIGFHDENGQQTADLKADLFKIKGGFQTGNWQMAQSSEADGNTLDFFFVGGEETWR